MISTSCGLLRVARPLALVLFCTLQAGAQQTPFHFDGADATGRHAGLSVPAGIRPGISGLPLVAGDEIGVFGRSSGVCGGAGVWTGFNLVIPLWGDDPLTPEVDGLLDAEPLAFRVWREGTDTEYSDVTVQYAQGNGLFQENGLYVLGALHVDANLPAAPQLIFPSEGDTVATDTPLLQWTPIGGGFQPLFQLRLCEMFPGQAAEEALDGNTPRLEAEGLFSTSLLYPSDALELESGHTYAWRVRAVDDNGNAAAENNGYSAVGRFSFRGGGSGEQIVDAVRLGGTVRDFTTDEPIGGAQLIYTRCEMRNGQLLPVPGSELQCTSSSAGAFLFEQVEDQSWFRLRVSHPGHQELTLSGPEVYIEGEWPDLQVLLQPLGGSLQGRVVNATGGAAVTRARVELGRDGRILQVLESDTDGGFHFGNLPPAQDYGLRVTHEGWSGDQRSPIGLQSGQNLDLGDIPIRPLAARVRVTLGTPDGVAVPGAQVYLFDDEGLQLDPGAQGSGSLPTGTLVAGPLVTGNTGSCPVPDRAPEPAGRPRGCPGWCS
jgi:hypothetical protein